MPQGRLADGDKKLGKEDMISMIQYGAQEIFRGTDGLFNIV